MISILQEQLFRLKKSKLFWVMLILCAAAPLLSLLLTLFIAAVVGGFAGDVSGETVTAIDILRELNVIAGEQSMLTEFAQLLSDFSLFALITSSVVLSKEFTDGTMRNVILANKSRRQMYFAYLCVALLIGVTYMLATFAAIMLICAPICGFGSLSAGEATSACFCSLALGLLATVFVQSCVCMFLFTVRKQWATVLFPLLICMFAPGIIEIIVSAIDITSLIKDGSILPETIKSWIPLVNANLYNSASIDGALVGKIALYYSLFSAVFITSGYFTFEKVDLK